MSEIIITFCGHSSVPNKEETMRKLVQQLTGVVSEIPAEQCIIFYCGGYGDFDYCAEKATLEIKKAFPRRDIKRFYITPYIDDSHKERLNDMEKRFDGTVYPPLESVPLKFAISKRNEWMIDQADVFVSGVTHDWGGGATTLKYAERKKKRIISVSPKN